MRPSDRSYSESHEWAKLNGDVVLVGITDFAIEQLGELVYLDLPQLGRALRRGESFGEVESVKAVSDLYSPVEGEIVDVNRALADALDTLQKDPFGGGWLIKLRVKNPSAALAGLHDAKAYDALVAAAH